MAIQTDTAGIKKVSELSIDANKDWAAKKIENLGAPDSADDAKRHDSAPAAHKASHEPAGGDAMAVDAIAATGSLRTLGAGAQQAMPGDAAPAPGAHAASHEDLGGDEIDVGGLSGLLADDQHVLDAEVLVVAAPLIHKNRHDPEDGADKLDTAAGSTIQPDDAAAVGTSHSLARADHKHAIVAAVPVTVAAANAEGDSTSFARANHVHEREHAKYLNTEAVAACEAAGLDLATGKNINLISNLISDHTWAGLTAPLQAGENLTITQLVYVKNDGKMWKAKSDAAATMPAIAMATASISADAWGKFLLLGFFRDDDILTFTLGDMLYVSDTVAGAFDNVLPADAGEQVQVLGKCLNTTHIIYFNPSLELVEIS